VEFSVLGTLEVTAADGTRLRLPTGRARTVLALLCVSPGQVVSRDRLIDEAWEGAPPGTAVTQMHGLISALRRVLGQEAVLTRGRGYLVAVGETDLTRMRALARRARSLREEGSLGAAAGCLGEALALWRGRPFAGIDCASLETTANLIESERVSALEEYAEVKIALGDASELVGSLAGWVAEHPLREGLRASLIRVLLRTGRQAEAIAAYHDLRRRLSDELGVGPGPALHELYESILHGDWEPVTPVGAAAIPVPAQLPAAVADFTGRAAQVDELRAALSLGSQTAVVVSAVSGTGGIGKSALAVHVAHLMRADFPGGQLFVSLAGTSGEPVTPADALARLLRDLGVPAGDVPAGLDERAARYRTALDGRRLLLVLDDARDAAQVRPLLPGSPSCAVLVTSRATLRDLAGSVHFGLSVMVPDEGRELFTKIVGAARTAAEPDAVAEILRVCAGLPLAIRITAAKLASRPGWSIAAGASRLTAEHDRLAELTVGDLAVRASFRLSYDGFTGDAAYVFRLLGLMPAGDFGGPAVAALLGLPVNETERILEPLIDAHMLESPGSGRYKMHDLLRLFAAELATADLEPADRAAAVGRVVGWYGAALFASARAIAQGRPMPPGRDLSAEGAPEFGSQDEALAWCHREQGSVAWAIRTAAAAGAHETAARMAGLLWMQADHSGDVAWIEAAYRTGLHSARALDDKPAEAWLLNILGTLLNSRLERVEEGIELMKYAMLAYEGLGDKSGAARVHGNLGTGYHNLGQNAAALEQFELAEAIHDSLGHDRFRALSLSNAGTACRSMGAYDQALDRYARALEIRQRIGDRPGEGVTRTSLGVAYRLMGRLSESLEQHRLAVSIQREIGANHWWLLSALDETGQTLADMGRDDEAREVWTETALLAGEAGDPRATEFRGRLSASKAD
jgi:DNA-binding SARP family transcriptional activator/tetratricopeptide (TPR) repeat protein